MGSIPSFVTKHFTYTKICIEEEICIISGTLYDIHTLWAFVYNLMSIVVNIVSVNSLLHTECIFNI